MNASTIPLTPTLSQWQKRSQSRFGRWLFTRSVCRRAPYFASIKPYFLELRPKLCVVLMPRHNSTGGPGGAAHPLAIATLCELAASTVTEVTLPPGMSWHSRGMTIEYLRRAQTDVTATARLDKAEWGGEAHNIAVPVSAVDRNGAEVVRAVITVRIEPGAVRPS
jgi:acyl-coenzyme A thioesterase PaaI-like protein